MYINIYISKKDIIKLHNSIINALQKSEDEIMNISDYIMKCDFLKVYIIVYSQHRRYRVVTYMHLYVNTNSKTIRFLLLFLLVFLLRS